VANVMHRLDVAPGDRVATLAWNNNRHLELFFGVAGTGGVLHTVNPRLFPEEVRYILDHAEDSYVFFDTTFTALLEELAPHLLHVRGYVALADADGMPAAKLPNLMSYEALLADASDAYDWPVFDENTASSLCY